MSSPQPLSSTAFGSSQKAVFIAVFAALLLAALILKAGYVEHRTFSSDESQHLHVVWGWTQGMVQYRDYFDNHAPLFHLLLAPVLKTLGERADILHWMRVAMLPLWALSCGAVGWLGTRLYSSRAGLFAFLLAAACPPLLLYGSEFRADILWAALWLVTAAVALSGSFSKRRALATGLLLGACFGTSMKTSLLLCSALSAFGLLLALMRPAQRQAWLAGGWGRLGALGAGLAVVPLAILGGFAAAGALPSLIYCVFTHNIGGPAHPRSLYTWLLALALTLAAAGFASLGRSLLNRQVDADWRRNARVSLLLLTPLFYHLYLAAFWPLVTRQDYLPCLPLLAVPLAGLLAMRKTGLPLAGAAVALEMAMAFLISKPFHAQRQDEELLIRDVLTLTRPGDPVMDQKGETVFRPRPFYYCLESITAWKITKGLIPNTITDQMTVARTLVCVAPNKFPVEAREWIERHYLPVTPKLCVAGCRIPAGEGDTPRTFELPVSAHYQLEDAEGPATALVDGSLASGPVYLTAGTHSLVGKDRRPLTLIWARALEKGFKPLTPSL